MKRWSWVITVLGVSVAARGHAHVAVASGPAEAGVSSIITFSVGHGCSGADTYRVEITMPAGVTSVRALDSSFGKGVIQRDGAGTVTSVVWTRPSTGDVLAQDDHFHEVAVRLKVPNAPFTQLAFPTIQTCRNAQGQETVVRWTSTDTGHDPGGDGGHGHATDGGMAGQEEPAPMLVIRPRLYPGWNKLQVAEHVHDLLPYFADAQVVWVGNAAYSANPSVAALITADRSVQPLAMIMPGDQVWVLR